MLKRLEISGFKSFARKTVMDFSADATAIVGPNGSGKSNVAEAFRFALGEQSIKSMRGKRSEDLIWSGSHTTARSNRAAVAIVFDNTKRIFPRIEYDEVTIERAVFRDGASEYLINGSKVRLRDIQELLASANIGETGHHIISQGEADRILLAHPRERRAMLEDALGLKNFEFKKQEASRKLEKTEDNVREVEGLRREIAPHIRFLKKQVERLERAESLITELIALAQTYFAIEDLYLRREAKKVEQEMQKAQQSRSVVTEELRAYDERTTTDAEGAKHIERIKNAERTLDKHSQERSQLSREIGRVEGALESAKRSVTMAHDLYVKVPHKDLALLKSEIESQSQFTNETSIETLRATLKTLNTFIQAFFTKFATPNPDVLEDDEQTIYKLTNEHKDLIARDQDLEQKVSEGRIALMRAREESMAYEETGREQRHRVIEMAEMKAQAESALSRLEGRTRELTLMSEELEREKLEVMALAGIRALSFDELHELPQEDRQVQEDRKRGLVRLKIRVEEAGGGGEDVKKEYEDAVSREEFLTRELEDMAKSAAGLRELIADLDAELMKTFSEGLIKVNSSFNEFFGLMFGGGGAKLVLEDPGTADEASEEEEDGDVDDLPVAKKQKAGIEISVHLPKKRVQSLMQLSGGERALTSIALIFAMSQVNPPPFLILDETDAALDEANSRRYGDMIASLAKKSQLIVISHNRETMSRAGILYGVTMGADGVSKLLSIKFDEAVAVAK